MSQILLICLFLVWTMWHPGLLPPMGYLPLRLAIFFGTYAMVTAALALWSRRLAREINLENLHRSVGRFNRAVHHARLFVPIWFGVGTFVLGWGEAMAWLFPSHDDASITWYGMHLPTVTLGILPGLLAWMSLWWAQFPADRAMRESNVLNQLEADLPVTAPPLFRHYFSANFRMQVLFVCIPLLAMVALHDLFFHIWAWCGGEPSDTSEMIISVLAGAKVFIFGPLAIRYILSTEPLPDSPLRKRLVALGKQSGVKYREILLWNTHHHVCNAAVMGLVAPVRYVLLTDALISSMTDDQIEAVFAHELGHVVHRHMVWYAIFFVLFLAIGSELTASLPINPAVPPSVLSAAMAGGFLVAFSFLSRVCEREADVYASRTLEWLHGPAATEDHALVLSSKDLAAPVSISDLDYPPLIAAGSISLIGETFAMPRSSAKSHPPVGRHGAALFASALHRVAIVNSIPLSKFDWLHGSILRRSQFVRRLAREPQLTPQFDRQMQLLHAFLLLGLVASLLWWGVGMLPNK